VGIRPLACWDCGFESRRGHMCLSVDSVVRCHAETSATSRSLIQRIPTEVVCLSVNSKLQQLGGPDPLGGGRAVKNVDIRNADTPYNK